MNAATRALIHELRERHIQGRVALEFLARSERFGFAGLPKRVSAIHVIQRTTWDEQRNLDLPYGPPAAWSTRVVDFAIFTALTDRDTVMHKVSEYSTTAGTDAAGVPWFRASPDVISYAARPETEGWVHVVDAGRFTPYNRLEMYSPKPIRPLLAIRVTGVDLPRGIYVRPTIPKSGREILP